MSAPEAWIENPNTILKNIYYSKLEITFAFPRTYKKIKKRAVKNPE